MGDGRMTGHIVITGAGGFIGRALGKALLDAGERVVGVDTSIAGVPAGVAAVVGDVRRPQQWAQVLTGARAVVHTAALVSNVAPLTTAWEVNVAGTAAVLRQAARAGVGRFVHVSSIAVFGFDFPDQVDESYPLRVTGFSYPDTKVAAEATVLAAHSRGEIDAVIVRPGDVYGPESRPWVLEPLRIIRARQAILPSRGNGVFSPVYIDDLVAGIVLAIDAAGAGGGVFTLTSGEGVSCREYFGHLAAMVGGRVRSAPPSVAFALAGMAGAVQRAVGQPSELCAASVHMLNRKGTYSIRRAREELGYNPEVGLVEGMARTEEWLSE